MKLRITNKGWDNYTGYLGQVEFVDGVSVKDVLDMLLETYKLNDIHLEIVPDRDIKKSRSK